MRSEAGVTLVEVLLAAGLLASALVSLTALVGLAIDANASSGDLTRAAVLAEARLEALLAPQGAPPAADGVQRVEYLDPAGRLVAAAGQGVYARRWRISPVPGGPPGASLLVVEVSRSVAVGQRVATIVAIRRPGP